MMWFSTPCNLQDLFTAVRLTALAAVLEKYPHVYVVADEIYEHLLRNFCIWDLSRNV
jgi:aspartate aminotransferase